MAERRPLVIVDGIVSELPTIDTTPLADSGVVVGTYPKVTVDSKGRVTNGAALSSADIPSLDTSKLTTGTLTVSRGGTGASTLTGILKGNGTNAFTAATAGTDYVVPSGSITGNAATATVLQTARTINGVSFNGSANITIADSTKIPTTEKGAVNGVATLGADGKVPSTQLPSYVDDVLEFANLASFPATGESGKIYVALDTNKTYRWSGSAYVYITSGAVDSVAGKTGVVTLVKADVGLSNVDNTSDATKNVLSATKWTTPRTVTIGSTGKSVDGSGNIIWTLAEIGAQALDADLTAIAALAGTSGLLRKTAADTWSLDTNTYVTSSGVTSVTGTAPIISSGGTTPAISISAATTGAAGSMSAADKTKLDGIATGAEVNQNAFSNIAVSGQTTVAADAKTDTVTFIAGSNVTITTDAVNDTVTFSATNTTYGVATSTVAGLVELGSDTVQSTAANAVTSTASRTYASQLNASGQLVVNVPWTDTNTTYSAGTGLSLVGTTFSNTAPDQTVVLTGSGATSVSGTYPSFTISSTDTVYTHPTSGVTAGTYKSVTVDTNGHVTAGTNPTTLAGYGITDAALATHNHTLDSLSNVAITSNTGGEILKWSGTAWINNTLAEAGIQPAGSYLTTNQTITFSGDATGSGSTAVTLTLANSGVTAGTYPKVTVDAKGRVTSGTTLSSTDIPPLDASKITTGIIDAARLPAYVDDVIEAANLASFPTTGETGKIYMALDTNKTYRWSGSTYVYITSGAVDSVAGKTGVVTLVKGDVGLANVDNTSDATKNVLSATKLTTARTINGVSFDGTANITIADSTKQPLDADLTAIAALAGTSGLLRKTAADTWSLDTTAYTANLGTVTSVGLSLPSILTVSGSPVTTSGTLSATLASQTANTVFAAPNGSAGAPTFRALVTADIPSLDASKITTGTLAVANGGTGLASYVVGDLVFASGTTTLSKLADVATGNVLLSGGVGVAPSYGKVGLTTHVSGTLAVANGGTGATTSTGSGSVVLSTSPTLTTPNIGVATGTSFNSITGLASVTPLVAGTAAVGTSTAVARQDHVHPAQTSVSGNAGTATTLQTARTLTIGSTGKTFNGSANVSWSLAEMGAAPTVSPAFTGTPTAPTATVTTNTTQVATTEFVQTKKGYATGASGEEAFFLNETTINNSYTIPTNYNAGTFGPVTVADGVTITVPDNSSWTVV